VRDARDRGGGGADAARDLGVRHAAVDEARGGEAVRERLELADRAEVAQEREHLVAVPEAQERVGDGLEAVASPGRRHARHVSTLSC
jgi:hypothetical protein